MATSKKVITKKTLIAKYTFAAGTILLGIIFNLFNIGKSTSFTYSSVGNYFIYIGFLMVIFVFITSIVKKDKVIDERDQQIMSKAMGCVWLSIFLGAFIVMIIDKIQPIQLSIGLFASYSVCVLLIIYFISYKFLEKMN